MLKDEIYPASNFEQVENEGFTVDQIPLSPCEPSKDLCPTLSPLFEELLNYNDASLSVPLYNKPESKEEKVASTVQLVQPPQPVEASSTQSYEKNLPKRVARVKKQISKDKKGYIKTSVINSATGRRNQVLQCLTCEK